MRLPYLRQWGLLITACGVCLTPAQTAPLVHVEFFYNPDCTHCRAPLDTIRHVAQRYAPHVTVLVHHVVTVQQYRELMAMEDALGLGRRESLAVYVGTNCLYGATAIAAGLETLVTSALARGGAAPWRPSPAAASFSSATTATNQLATASVVMPRTVAYVGCAVGSGVAALAVAILLLRRRRHTA